MMHSNQPVPLKAVVRQAGAGMVTDMMPDHEGEFKRLQRQLRRAERASLVVWVARDDDDECLTYLHPTEPRTEKDPWGAPRGKRKVPCYYTSVGESLLRGHCGLRPGQIKQATIILD